MLAELTRRANQDLAHSRRLTLVGVVLIVVIAAAAPAGIWSRNHGAILGAEREATNLSVVPVEQLARSIQAVNLVLQETGGKLTAGIEGPDEAKAAMACPDVRRFLIELIRQHEGNGTTVAITLPACRAIPAKGPAEAAPAAA